MSEATPLAAEEQARSDIALIRVALEQGRAYATARSPDMLVWGVLVSAGYAATWGFVAGRFPFQPGITWTVLIVAGWLWSLRRFLAGQPAAPRRPMANALGLLWLGTGITLSLIGFASLFVPGDRGGWFDVAAPGVLASAFFASAPLCNLAWLRGIAVLWWLAGGAIFALRGSIAVLPLSALFYLLLLGGPGLVLLLRRQAAA